MQIETHSILHSIFCILHFLPGLAFRPFPAFNFMFRMLSTRSLHLLPDIEAVRRTCQAIAALDAVLSPEPQFRYYHYQHNFAKDRQLASMLDDSGDEWFILFSPAGALLKGFVPDSLMAEPVNHSGTPWPGVIDDVPPAFHEIFNDPRYWAKRSTFCTWRLLADSEWRRGRVQFPPGKDPDGSEHLMAILDGEPVTYARWAEQYYEIEIPFIEVRRIYMHRTMTEEMAKSLNPRCTWNMVAEELEKIGYPVSSERAT